MRQWLLLRMNGRVWDHGEPRDGHRRSRALVQYRIRNLPMRSLLVSVAEVKLKRTNLYRLSSLRCLGFWTQTRRLMQVWSSSTPHDHSETGRPIWKQVGGRSKAYLLEVEPMGRGFSSIAKLGATRETWSSANLRAVTTFLPGLLASSVHRAPCTANRMPLGHKVCSSSGLRNLPTTYLVSVSGVSCTMACACQRVGSWRVPWLGHDSGSQASTLWPHTGGNMFSSGPSDTRWRISTNGAQIRTRAGRARRPRFGVPRGSVVLCRGRRGCRLECPEPMRRSVSGIAESAPGNESSSESRA